MIKHEMRSTDTFLPVRTKKDSAKNSKSSQWWSDGTTYHSPILRKLRYRQPLCLSQARKKEEGSAVGFQPTQVKQL